MQCDNVLSKANRPKDYDATKSVRGDLITQGMESAISSGNWTIRRFRMERKGVTQVPAYALFGSAAPAGINTAQGYLMAGLCKHAVGVGTGDTWDVFL